MDFFSWLFTPALIGSLLLLAGPFFVPAVRWARRLKSDVGIFGGMPESEEKDLLGLSITRQAERLREYREVMLTGKYLVGLWIAVAYIATAVILVILFPPINKPGDRYQLGIFDYGMMAIGLLIMVVALFLIFSGRDFYGRTPRALIWRDRAARHYRRHRKLRRLQQERVKHPKPDGAHRPEGSSLGFSTQVDPLAYWASADGRRELRDHML